MALTNQQFKQEAYDATGLTEPFEATVETIRSVAGELLQDRQDHDASPLARAALWELGSDAIKSSLVIGSVVNNLTYGYQRLPEQKLLFSSGDELAETSRGTDSEPVTVTALCAVADRLIHHREGRLPSLYLPWATPFATTAASDEQQAMFNDRLQVINFSDTHTDSGEDMGDTHPVHSYVFQDDLPLPLRSQLLEAAFRDTDVTSYKPHVWSARLNNTLGALAAAKDNPLRYDARKRLSVPISDDDYQVYVAGLDFRKAILRVERLRQTAESKRDREIRRLLKASEIRAKVKDLLQPRQPQQES